MVSERFASLNLNGSAPNRIAVTINIKRAIGGADDDGDRSARAALRIPIVAIMRKWAQHLRRKILRREHQAGTRGEMWHGRFAIPHHDRAALRRFAEKQLREIVGEANATVAGRITG